MWPIQIYADNIYVIAASCIEAKCCLDAISACLQKYLLRIKQSSVELLQSPVAVSWHEATFGTTTPEVLVRTSVGGTLVQYRKSASSGTTNWSQRSRTSLHAQHATEGHQAFLRKEIILHIKEEFMAIEDVTLFAENKMRYVTRCWKHATAQSMFGCSQAKGQSLSEDCFAMQMEEKLRNLE